MKNLIGLILVLSMLAFCIYIIGGALTSLESNDSDMKKNVGKEVVLDKDTLIILDYSVWNSSYTLSNGVSIDESFLERDTIN